MALIPLYLFARPPRPGSAKTRLGPRLGREGAARLYAAFLEDVVATVATVPGVAPMLAVTEEDPFLDGLADRHGWPIVPQAEGDLGAKMAAAIADGIARAGAGLVVGSDAPTLPARAIAALAKGLDDHGFVLGPAADGGYWGIGARVVPSFAGVRFSTEHALADTRAANAGLRTKIGEPWFDVDEPRDVHLLATQLGIEPWLAPHTAGALRELGLLGTSGPATEGPWTRL